MFCSTKDQNNRQFSAMIQEFLKIYYSAVAFDAHDIAIGLRSCWGVRADWHEVSYVLDRQLQHGVLKHEGFSGDRMVRYSLKA